MNEKMKPNLLAVQQFIKYFGLIHVGISYKIFLVESYSFLTHVGFGSNPPEKIFPTKNGMAAGVFILLF